MTTDFNDALNWLIIHQKYTNENINNRELTYISHPDWDGDGFATRVYRLVNRIIPIILKGNIVILTKGFRGYTNHIIGFTSLFLPFAEKVEINNEWEKLPPKKLLNKSYDWWFGVIAYYFLRPNETISEYIDEMREELKQNSYIGLHLRYGDNLYGNEISLEKYKEIVKKFKTPNEMYISTDCSKSLNEIIKYFSNKKIFYQRNYKSIDMSTIGTSLASILLHNEREPWIIDISKEVICDILLLSECNILIGLSVSQITNVARLIGIARGNISEVVVV
jgi:hypothetical protein